MPRECEQIAIWAQSCALQCASGVKLVDVIESCVCFGNRRHLLVAKSLRLGQSIKEAFTSFLPHITVTDIAFLDASQRTGNLSEGFDLLASQYFIRARTQSVLFAAFVYPVGILLIGLFLMSLQPVLYEEMTINTAVVLFAKRVVAVFLGLYLCKRILSMRPPLLCALLRLLPPFRGLSCALSVQRFTWFLERSSIAALPIRDAILLASEVSGRPAVIQRAKAFDREIGLGSNFQSSFGTFLRAWPSELRRSISINSPSHVPQWAQYVVAKNDDALARSIGWIERLAKPLALMLTAPLILFVIQQLWFVMATELSQRFGPLL